MLTVGMVLVLIQDLKYLALRARLSNTKLKGLWGSLWLNMVVWTLGFLAEVTAVFSSLVLEIGLPEALRKRKPEFVLDKYF